MNSFSLVMHDSTAYTLESALSFVQSQQCLWFSVF